MSKEFKDLQDTWKTSKENIAPIAGDHENLLSRIKSLEKENIFFYYGTFIVLLITLIIISLFFTYVAPVKASLSRLGAILMIGGLAYRIGIEAISIYKAKQVNSWEGVVQTIDKSLIFYGFRKKIHLIHTPIIIFLYTIGFYMITPEFSLYIKFWNVVLIDVSFVFIGIVLFIVLRKQVKQEMNKLTELAKLRKEISD